MKIKTTIVNFIFGNIKLLFPILCLFIFSCKNEPSTTPAALTPFDYGCETSKAQLMAVDSLVAVMQKIDAWGEDSALDSISDLNDLIYSELKKLLDCGAVEKLDIHTETFEHLYYTQTADGRVRNFNWYANNGGTWQEMRQIYQYYPQPHIAKTTASESLAGATRFFQLKSDQPMYLGFGADKMCSTCMAEYASVFSFKNDTLHVENIIFLEARMGDILNFEFDPATQTLNYTVLIDDLNQDWATDKNKQKIKDVELDLSDFEGWEPTGEDEVVIGKMVFDGKVFVEQ